MSKVDPFSCLNDESLLFVAVTFFSKDESTCFRRLPCVYIVRELLIFVSPNLSCYVKILTYLHKTFYVLRSIGNVYIILRSSKMDSKRDWNILSLFQRRGARALIALNYEILVDKKRLFCLPIL